jgi:osmotically-inducible protein OsmY
MKSTPFVFVFLLLPLISGCGGFLSAIDAEPITDDPGERTMGAQVEDESIETKSTVNISAADPGLSHAHIITVSYNAHVLIAGQVPTPALKEKASEVVRDIRGVRHIYNELEVGGNTSSMTRSSDTWITTKVKSALLANSNIEGGRVKVFTENGVVYLMGLASRAEGKRIADIASTAQGVQKVVRLFEYFD